MKIYKKGISTDFKYAVGETDIYGKTFHDCYEIFLLVSGSVEFISENTRTFIEPYTLVIIPPGCYHQFIVAGDMKIYERCVLNLYSSFLDDEILKTALSDKEIVTLNSNDRIIHNFLHLVECAKAFDNEDFKYVCDGLSLDITFLLKNIAKTPEILPGSLRPETVEIMKYINSHYSEEINTKMLSDIFHLSVSSLCHKFKEDFGIPVKQYILRKRMNQAKQLIDDGVRPEQACRMCGYVNYSAFYRAYTGVFGKAPSK